MQTCKLHLAIGSAIVAFAVMPNTAYASPGAGSGPDTGAPINDAAVSAPVQVEVSAGTANKLGTIKFNLTRIANSDAADENASDDTFTEFTVTLSTPWDGTNEAIPANLDGLASGTKLKLGYSHYWTTTANQPSERTLAIVDEARAACRIKAAATRDSRTAALGSLITPELTATINGEFAKAIEGCNDPDAQPNALLTAYLPGRQRAYVAEMVAPLQAINLNVAVGYDKFGYVNPISLVAGSDEKVGWSAGISYSRYLTASPTAFTIGFDYERAYKAQPKRIICPVATTPNPVLCIQDHIGPPTLDESGLVRFNLRHRFVGTKGNTLFAVSPNVTYDAFDDQWGFELPIYFIPDGKGALSGGVKIGYTTEDKDFTFGLFIGASFGLAD